MLTLLAVALALAAAPKASAAAASPLNRPDVPHVRVMTWNIGANSIFQPGPRGRRGSDEERPARFRRLLRAVDPDVLCLQEVFEPHTAADVGLLLDGVIALGGERRWHVHGQPDVVIAARFPITRPAAQKEDWGGGVPRTHAMGLVELPSDLGTDGLYVLCAHVQSRGEPKDVAARQEQADAIAAWLRDLRRPGGDAAPLPPRTPLVLLGDWNAYETDPRHHLSTLMTGDIVNARRFGKGAAPDQGGALLDALPAHNGKGSITYTFGDGSATLFPPAALDRVFYSGSRLERIGGFVLDTTRLTPAELTQAGLAADDILLNTAPRTYDHLPVVVDFAFKPGS